MVTIDILRQSVLPKNDKDYIFNILNLLEKWNVSFSDIAFYIAEDLIQESSSLMVANLAKQNAIFRVEELNKRVKIIKSKGKNTKIQ